MKNDKQQQAKHLYFQTNLTKTQIADYVGVNRRTIMLWCQQNNWDKLKLSGRHLPAMVAEKCYYLIDHLATSLLMVGAEKNKISPRDADAINKLSASIKRLKNRSAANESMEMFNFFLEYLRKKDEKLVEVILPHIEGYIETRKDVQLNDFLLEGFNSEGYIPLNVYELDDKNWDITDTEAFNQELKKTGDYDQALDNWLNEKDQSA